MGEIDNAILEWKKALSLDPNNLTIEQKINQYE